MVLSESEYTKLRSVIELLEECVWQSLITNRFGGGMAFQLPAHISKL